MPADEPEEASELGALVREVLERIGHELRLSARVTVAEDDDTVTASFSGSDLGLLIGRREGRPSMLIQYLVNAIVFRTLRRGARKQVVVDAAHYRERRRATLESLAVEVAARVRSSGERVELEPMSAPERKVIHLRLQDEAGVATESEGVEPHRYLVVFPSE